MSSVFVLFSSWLLFFTNTVAAFVAVVDYKCASHSIGQLLAIRLYILYNNKHWIYKSLTFHFLILNNPPPHTRRRRRIIMQNCGFLISSCIRSVRMHNMPEDFPTILVDSPTNLLNWITARKILQVKFSSLAQNLALHFRSIISSL